MGDLLSRGGFRIDGHFSPNYKSNALAYSAGTVQWVPPFIYKSGCDTNPHFFPFDVSEKLYLLRGQKDSFRTTLFNFRIVGFYLRCNDVTYNCM